jgi:hypothetical protein
MKMVLTMLAIENHTLLVLRVVLVAVVTSNPITTTTRLLAAIIERPLGQRTHMEAQARRTVLGRWGRPLLVVLVGPLIGHSLLDLMVPMRLVVVAIPRRPLDLPALEHGPLLKCPQGPLAPSVPLVARAPRVLVVQRLLVVLVVPAARVAIEPPPPPLALVVQAGPVAPRVLQDLRTDPLPLAPLVALAPRDRVAARVQQDRPVPVARGVVVVAVTLPLVNPTTPVMKKCTRKDHKTRKDMAVKPWPCKTMQNRGSVKPRDGG